MNDLGMTLAWSAIQITLILVPAAVLHIDASRRSPASGVVDRGSRTRTHRGDRSRDLHSVARTR